MMKACKRSAAPSGSRPANAPRSWAAACSVCTIGGRQNLMGEGGDEGTALFLSPGGIASRHLCQVGRSRCGGATVGGGAIPACELGFSSVVALYPHRRLAGA